MADVAELEYTEMRVYFGWVKTERERIGNIMAEILLCQEGRARGKQSTACCLGEK